jgi:hypothetical protein
MSKQLTRILPRDKLSSSRTTSAFPRGTIQLLACMRALLVLNAPASRLSARLTCDRTDADWGRFVLDQSYFGKDPNTGKPITFDEWDKANPGAKTTLRNLLNGWADDMSRQGLNTLGVRITIPSEQQRNLYP